MTWDYSSWTKTTHQATATRTRHWDHGWTCTCGTSHTGYSNATRAAMAALRHEEQEQRP